MAIQPPSDIISEVARAADPAKYQMAAARLVEGARPSDAGSFDDAMRTAGLTPSGPAGFDSYAARNTLRSHTPDHGADRAKLAYQQFEASVLQSFVESMMPKNAESMFGKGSAGAVWKSMMAEQIAGQVAKAGGIGIADHILKDRDAVRPRQTGAVGIAPSAKG